MRRIGAITLAIAALAVAGCGSGSQRGQRSDGRGRPGVQSRRLHAGDDDPGRPADHDLVQRPRAQRRNPNQAAAPDDFSLRITRGGAPVRGAKVTLAFNHLQMQMPQQTYALREVAPGVYHRSAPADHGRPLEPGVLDRGTRGATVQRADRRPSQRMSPKPEGPGPPEPPPAAEPPPPAEPLRDGSAGPRLIAAGLAMVAGIAALVIAILLVRGALL